MLKRIPKSDISIRPFKAYKEWNFYSGSSDITLLDANEYSSNLNLISTGNLTGSLYPKNSIYGQLRAQFYNGNEDNPFMRLGHKTNVYDTDFATKERYLSGSAKVISIPQIYVGEGIKKGSFTLTDSTGPYIDDKYGNVISATGLSEMDFNLLDLSGSIFEFTSTGNSFTASIDYLGTPPVMFVDIQNGQLELVIDGTPEYAEIISFDIESGIIYVNSSTFLPSLSLGNIFYNQGLVVLTRNLDLILKANWDISYKSTQTIYENEYLLIVNQDEFNVSQNPSAVIENGRETSYVTNTDGKIQKVTTNPGVKYIRKAFTLENGTGSMDYSYTYTGSIGTNKAGFEHWDLSGSIDTTGSFLAPFITTIGLYDDNCDLVAVAKLPQPIKSEPDIPVNFIVRFDT
jgi:hypothetical protein